MARITEPTDSIQERKAKKPAAVNQSEDMDDIALNRLKQQESK